MELQPQHGSPYSVDGSSTVVWAATSSSSDAANTDPSASSPRDKLFSMSPQQCVDFDPYHHASSTSTTSSCTDALLPSSGSRKSASILLPDLQQQAAHPCPMMYHHPFFQEQLPATRPHTLQWQHPHQSGALTAADTIAFHHHNPSHFHNLAEPPSFDYPSQLSRIDYDTGAKDGNLGTLYNPPHFESDKIGSTATNKRLRLHTAEQLHSTPDHHPHPQPPATKNPSHQGAGAGSSSTVGRVCKEKLGERITALQQLVSPFGKTDTASVLSEAHGYIKFLQDQVQVLSSPYLKPALTRKGSVRRSIGEAGDQQVYMGTEEDIWDLRSRGLCLVPVSCTLHVASNVNGADYWASSAVGSTSARHAQYSSAASGTTTLHSM